MALEMRGKCERCGTALTEGDDAVICAYEGTFCRSCAEGMDFVCLNCGGDLVSRPKRVTA